MLATNTKATVFRKFPQGYVPCGNSAFTVVELLAAITIVGVLAALVFLNYDRIITTMEQMRCSGNLRALHSGFASYLNDYEQWPQQPDFGLAGGKAAYEQWWLKQLAPYGITEKTWQCPTAAKRSLYEPPEARDKMHYVPTRFDANPLTPRRWATQPWISEVTEGHGSGPLIIFCDGSIHASDEFLAQ